MTSSYPVVYHRCWTVNGLYKLVFLKCNQK